MPDIARYNVSWKRRRSVLTVAMFYCYVKRFTVCPVRTRLVGSRSGGSGFTGAAFGFFLCGQFVPPHVYRNLWLRGQNWYHCSVRNSRGSSAQSVSGPSRISARTQTLHLSLDEQISISEGLQLRILALVSSILWFYSDTSIRLNRIITAFLRACTSFKCGDNKGYSYTLHFFK